MREQHDPVQLIVQLGAIALLLATVALSVESVRDITIADERSVIAGEQAHADGYAARCRTMTSERPDEACRRIWADNRRRFFGLDHEAGKASTIDTPTTPSQSSSDNSTVDSNRPAGSAIRKD
jgi:conjugative transfer region protein TrbK